MFGEQDVNVDGTEVLLTDLSKFHEYVFRVVAYNVNGPGPATDELTCRTFSDGNSCSFDFKSLLLGGSTPGIWHLMAYVLPCIGGFRDAYLGRQVVSRPGAGMGLAGGSGERCELL